MLKKTDEQLIADYLSGDDGSLEILIARYLNPIYYFVYRFAKTRPDAEDVTQEIFIKIWKNIKNFDQRRSFKTWVYAIAKNSALDWLKKKKAIVFSAFEMEDGENPLIDKLLSSDEFMVNAGGREDALRSLANAIEQLSPKYRDIVSLRLDKELNFREISEISGESLNTVKSRYRRAFFRLKNILNRA